MLDCTKIRRTDFYLDALDGLTSYPKTLPCKYFYDQKGSDLFEQITLLEEYYLTRTELSLLQETAAELSAFIQPNTRIVEYGAGALKKVRILLDGLEGISQFLPIDVSEDFLLAAAERLKESYPNLEVQPVLGNFLDPKLDIPYSLNPALGFFPGSTLGNLSDDEIRKFLSKAKKDLGASGKFLLGVDTNHQQDTLLRAYDDDHGVTAAFNMNLLERANRELGANFDLSSFQHEARWNEELSRVEMHLVSLKVQKIEICEKTIKFEESESIHTENSRKFSDNKIKLFALQSGWKVQKIWRSPAPSMSLFLLY